MHMRPYASQTCGSTHTHLPPTIAARKGSAGRGKLPTASLVVLIGQLIGGQGSCEVSTVGPQQLCRLWLRVRGGGVVRLG